MHGALGACEARSLIKHAHRGPLWLPSRAGTPQSLPRLVVGQAGCQGGERPPGCHKRRRLLSGTLADPLP